MKKIRDLKVKGFSAFFPNNLFFEHGHSLLISLLFNCFQNLKNHFKPPLDKSIAMKIIRKKQEMNNI